MATSARAQALGFSLPGESPDPASPALVEWVAGWVIEETEFGGIAAFHGHRDGARVGYVRTGADGRVVARCSACRAHFQSLRTGG